MQHPHDIPREIELPSIGGWQLQSIHFQSTPSLPTHINPVQLRRDVSGVGSICGEITNEDVRSILSQVTCVSDLEVRALVNNLSEIAFN